MRPKLALMRTREAVLAEGRIGVAVAVLLDILILRPVLLPAAEAVLGRFGWWPTATARAGPSETKSPRRLQRPSFRDRGVVHP